jgi:hypothetical protein
MAIGTTDTLAALRRRLLDRAEQPSGELQVARDARAPDTWRRARWPI